jgi:hypothetical protein
MKSKQMALCGLLCATAVVVMILASAIGIGTFMGPMLAMAMLLPVLEEYGAKSMAVAYVAAAILAFLLVPEVEQAAVFAAFGWYPILRPRLNDRIPAFILQLLIKAALGGGIILLLYGVVLRVLGMTADLQEAAKAFNILLAVLGVVTFLTMDVALEHLTILWHEKFRKRFFKH